jgi:hypothetical protein
MPPTSDDAELTNAIKEAAENALRELFAQHAERFYYITLTTSGCAAWVRLSAWSVEALERATAGAEDVDEERRMLKWSYSDSPYCGFGENHFDTCDKLFTERGDSSSFEDDDEWFEEYEVRLAAMARALQLLDEEGLFGTGEERNGVVIAAEVMPPDESNVERVTMLNPPAALVEWLSEAAEY